MTKLQTVIDLPVLLPFLTGFCSRTYAAIFIFGIGVIPPIPILGLSLL